MTKPQRLLNPHWNSVSMVMHNASVIRSLALDSDAKWPMSAVDLAKLIHCTITTIRSSWHKRGILGLAGEKVFLKCRVDQHGPGQLAMIERSDLELFLSRLEEQANTATDKPLPKCGKWLKRAAKRLADEDPDDWPMFVDDIVDDFNAPLSHITTAIMRGILTPDGKRVTLKASNDCLGCMVELEDWATFIRSALNDDQKPDSHTPMGSASLEAARAFLARTRK